MKETAFNVFLVRATHHERQCRGWRLLLEYCRSSLEILSLASSVQSAVYVLLLSQVVRHWKACFILESLRLDRRLLLQYNLVV